MEKDNDSYLFCKARPTRTSVITDILRDHKGENILLGTHGTALSTMKKNSKGQ